MNQSIRPYLVVAALAAITTAAVFWALRPDPDAWEHRARQAETQAADAIRRADSLLAVAWQTAAAATVADSLARLAADRADRLEAASRQRLAATTALRDSLATARTLADTAARQAALIVAQTVTIDSQTATIGAMREAFRAQQERAAGLLLLADDLGQTVRVQQQALDSLRGVLAGRPNRTRRDPCLTRWPTCLTLTLGGVVATSGVGVGLAVGIPVGRPGV